MKWPAGTGFLFMAIVLPAQMGSRAAEPARTGLTIANRGTENPTLLYNGKPMLRVGSVSEQAFFAFPWNSSRSVLKEVILNHEQWADWQRNNGMGFARAYPESGYVWTEEDPESEKIYPWRVVRWQDDHPVVDLTKFDPTYWNEFANTIRKCREKDIVLLIQLYQACYFLGYYSGGYGAKGSEGELTWWQTCYFHPRNNVNRWPIGTTWPPTGLPCGMDYPQRVVDDYPNGPWWVLHQKYVRKILDAIGNQGHVIIDLGNEVGYRREGLHCYGWVEKTLDIIEQWEKQNGADILVGMDEHFWFRVPGKRDWIRKHPRLETLIIHGAKDVLHEEGYDFKQGNTPRHPEKLRMECKKPCVSIHNQSERVKAANRHAGFQRLYQWLGMMQKVQGMASYGYGAFVNGAPSERRRYLNDTKYLMEVFDSLRDCYVGAIVCDYTSGRIVAAPGYDRYQHLLSSDQGVLFYTHTEQFDVKVPAGSVLKLRDLDMPDGNVRVRIMNLHSRKETSRLGTIVDGKVNMRLPSFFEDIAVQITGE
jgi:hypothetical protein